MHMLSSNAAPYPANPRTAQPYARTLIGIGLFVIALNAIIAFLYVIHKPFYPDEFQHAHIVWNMVHDGKVIYRDFWEHHGVIYPAFNYVLFKLFSLDASMLTLYGLRIFNYLGMFAIFALTYKIAMTVFNSRTVGVLAVAVLSSLLFFNMRVIEIRPDVLQNIFWLLGVYLILMHTDKAHGKAFVLPGVFFGLSILTNTKAAFGIAFVFAYLAGRYLFFPQHRNTALCGIWQLVLGIGSVFGIVLLYFVFVDGLYKYFESNYLFNFIEITRDSNPWVFPFFWNIFMQHQLTFMVACGIGLLALCVHTVLNRSNKLVFFTIITLGSTSGVLIGLFTQFYLMFFPFLAITVAFALARLCASVRSNVFLNAAVALSVSMLLFIPLERTLLHELSLMRFDAQSMIEANFTNLPFYSVPQQRDMIEHILAVTDRTEPIGYFWNACGIFTFNSDVQYYWSYMHLHGDVFEALTGEDAFGAQYVRALEDKKVRYITANPQEWQGVASRSTREYILSNYQYVSECLLERRTPFTSNASTPL